MTTTAADAFRVGSRVEIQISRRRRTVLATVTNIADETGRPAIVYDGDQTGAERRELPQNLTPIPQDVDELHADALRENELRERLGGAR